MSGFVDLQVNGYLGVDFSAPGLRVEEVRSVVEALRDRGTTAFCPTVITSSRAVYEENLPVLAQAMEEPDLAPHILGIHLEGPFISPAEGARGAHSKQYTATPDPFYYEELFGLSGEKTCLVTLAPELPGALELIRSIRESGVSVSLGHHLADPSQVKAAVDAGATAATHLGNGIPNRLPRHPNPIWSQLSEPELSAMLITDGHHLPSTFIRVVTRVKAPDHLIVTSDCAPIAGMPPGRYVTLGQEVLLEENGRLWNPVENHLVGSSSCLFDCMNHLSSLNVLTEEELWKAGCHNPLNLIGRTLDPGRGSREREVLHRNGRFFLGERPA
jgi:N-acetylglucosamine-6-phosphate deacetylase